MKYLTIVILFIGTIITTSCTKEWTCKCTTKSYEESGNWWTGTTTTTTTSITDYTVSGNTKSDAESSCKAKENSNTQCHL